MRSTTERILCPICRAGNRSDARFCQQCGNDVLLDNTYRITRVIKEGGMGVVYQAIDDDGEFYAVKEMHDRFTNAKDREEGIQRFIDEAKLLRTLRGHPNIPHVYRSFIDEGRYYLSMEFIFGEDLEDILKRQHRFPEPQVLIWADELCDVLEFMHSHGLIYRDMKPSNVMITGDGLIKVVDFGIAKLLQPGQRGTMIGTPGYAPPEQYQGITTVESDVYALAATLHHLLTGRDPRDEPPFSFPPAHTLRRDISIETSRALEKALEMEVDARFKSLSDFRRALPIPTGERQRTRAFDPQPRSRPTQRVAAPAAAPPRPQPRAAQQRPPQPVPVQRPPQPVVAQRPPQHAPAPPRRRRGGFQRAMRRVVATAIIGSGLYFGALQYRPDLVAQVQQYVTNVIQEYVPSESQPTTDESVPASGFDSQQFQATVELTVPEGTPDEQIRQRLQQGFVEKARLRYPGAELIPGSLPGTIGPIEQSMTTEGLQRISATMSGFVNVPKQ